MWNHRDAGSSPDVTRSHRLLFAVPAAASALALSACGGEEPEPTPAVGTTFASDESGGAASSSASASSSSAAATGAVADVSFDDQAGPGDSVVIARVVLPDSGFVVVTADDGDDDGDDDEDDRLVGAAALPAGESTDVRVPLSPVLTEDTDLEATLYGDTDGNGVFDPAVDQQVPESDDDGDDDGDVSEDADYDVP